MLLLGLGAIYWGLVLALFRVGKQETDVLQIEQTQAARKRVWRQFVKVSRV